MPKWKKDATEFTVGVSYHEQRGYQSSIPRPIVEFLRVHEDKSRDPEPITYVITPKGKVEMKRKMTGVNRPKKS